jgi:DNA-binding GntR family transcriptional regulator
MEDKKTSPYPELSLHAQEIITSAIQKKLKKGNRITELSMTEALHVSRTPVRKALRELSANGFLELVPNKGYFLKQNPEEIRFNIIDDPKDFLWLYNAIGKDRICRQLPEMVQENLLLRRYKTTRGLLKKVLAQIAEEGWIEKSLGYGWHFLPMIDSIEAYRDSYELRAIIEPEGILSTHFEGTSIEFEQMLEAQIFLEEEGFKTLSEKQLVKKNAEFHELIAAGSGNRFLHQTIQRLNKLRLVLEMFQSVNRMRVKKQAREHIKIIKLILNRDHKAASVMMKKHLISACELKLKDPTIENIFNLSSCKQH